MTRMNSDLRIHQVSILSALSAVPLSHYPCSQFMIQRMAPFCSPPLFARGQNLVVDEQPTGMRLAVPARRELRFEFKASLARQTCEQHRPSSPTQPTRLRRSLRYRFPYAPVRELER